MNDPYEALPFIKIDKYREQAIETASKQVLETLEEQLGKEEAHKAFSKNKEIIIEGVDNTLTYRFVSEQVMQSLSDSHLVLSLSRTHRSMLMWAHYAENYTGYMIGFDKSHELFKQSNGISEEVGPYVVQYSENREQVNREDSNWFEYFACTKPLEWAYEQEERIFVNSKYASKQVGKDKLGKKIYLFDLPKEAIRAVYIGPKASDETKKRILDSLKKNQIECEVYTSHLAVEEYKIIFELVKDPE